MPVTTFKAAPYFPTAPRTGDEGASLFRMKNMIVRGLSPRLYTEVYGGNENLSEFIASTALTGTITLVSGSKTIAGAGTAFVTELHLGQFVLAHDAVGTRSALLVVEKIVSNTSFVCSAAPTFSVAGITAYRMPVLFDVNKERGTLLRGNALLFDRGTYLGVGDGALRIGGAVLPGASFTAARTPKVGILNPATGNYSIYPLGMATPGAHTLAAVAGGVKNMQAGSYSILLYPKRTATGGYNNPGVKVVVTIAAGDKIRITFPAMDTVNGQDAWDIYGSLFDPTAPSAAELGPWYYVRTITATDLGGTGAGTTFDVEYLDAEVRSDATIATFDNDAPVAAEFVASVAGYPVYVSCQGPATAAAPTVPTSPGPVIIPAKPNNIEAAPTKYAVPLSPPETIIGCISALGRIYLMTPNRLQVAEFTNIETSPISVRPFWIAGFHNPYQLIFVNGTLYGWANGPTRSIAFADEGSEERSFAAEVEEITRTWVSGHVLVAHDPQNDCICFFHSSDSTNTFGYRTTRVLMYSLRQRAWVGDIVIEAENTDMIVSGVATINGQLEFLAGGRNGGGTVTVGSYRFDSYSSGTVSWYQAWQFTDSGEELRDKTIKRVRVTGIFAASSVGVHGASAGQQIDVAALQAGNTVCLSGSIALPSLTAQDVQDEQHEVSVEAAVWTLRVDGTWSGSNPKHRVNEAVAEWAVQGCRR